MTSEPDHQADPANEGATPGNDEDVGPAPAATDAANDTDSHDRHEREGLSLRTRGGGLGRLIRQCFGMRSPPSPVPLPVYVYHERHRPRHHSRHRPRSRPRRHRARHRSHSYDRSYSRREHRYHSPSHRRRSEHRPPAAAKRATRRANYDGMGDDELFNTLLAEERAVDPMLRTVDAR